MFRSLDTKCREIITWISGPEGQESYHDQFRAEHFAGTGEWFVQNEQFRSWLKRPLYPSNDKVFWCSGTPGVGKTMLASKIIGDLRNDHFCVIFFYMGKERLHPVSDVVASLLEQLCLPFRTVPDKLWQVYEESKDQDSSKPHIDDMIEALEQSSRGINQSIVFVWDGVDEIDVSGRIGFGKFLASLKDLPWKTFITSRQNQHPPFPLLSGCSQFSIQDDDVKPDIRNIVDSAISGSKTVGRMLSDDAELRKEVIDTLTSRSHGLFCWVTLQFRLVLAQTNISGIREVLERIPSDVRGMTDILLETIGLQYHFRAKLARRTLALIANAAAPLTADEACSALGLADKIDFIKSNHANIFESYMHHEHPGVEKIPIPASIVDCCMGLISTDPAMGVISIAQHDIAQDMRHRSDEILPKERLTLAEACITCLLWSDLSGGPCSHIEGLMERTRRYPFLRYASRYWDHHIREALLVERDDRAIEECVMSLLENRDVLEASLQLAEVEAHNRKALLSTDRQARLFDVARFRTVSSLQVASRFGLESIVENLLDHDPNCISKADSYSDSALHEASKAGWADIVRILLERGASPSHRNKEGKTPLYYAAVRGHTETTSLLEDSLLASPGSYDIKVEELQAVLFDAAENGILEAVRLLLDRNVDLNSQRNGMTALSVAVLEGHEQIVRLLLSKGVIINQARSPKDNTFALHSAIRRGYIKIAAILLRDDFDLQCCDESGRNALFATLDRSDLDGAEYLLQCGINMSCKDHEGNTVLHRAAAMGKYGHAELFVDQGIELNPQNCHDSTPLHLAVQHGHNKVAKLLIASNAKLDVIDCEGKTPLIDAVSSSNSALCGTLLRAGADVNWSNRQTDSPLVLAIKSGDVSIVQLLLEHGADCDVLDHEWRTPRELAEEYNHACIAATLADHGTNTVHRDV